MINALKNLFREKVISISIELDEAIDDDVDSSRELERDRAIKSKIDADAVFDRFSNAASIGDTFDCLGVQCLVTGIGIDSNDWVGTGRHSAYLKYIYRNKDLHIVDGQFSSDSITLFESLMSKSK